MKRLRERTVVGRPVEEAEAGVIAFFDRLRAPDGSIRMRLRVPVGTRAPFGFAVDRAVRVEIAPARDEQNLNDVLAISWSPEGTAMLPHFEGTLVVWGDEDPHSCSIEVDGRYAPPLGVAGQVFDEAIGHQIAQSTARELLYDIKRSIEAARAG